MSLRPPARAAAVALLLGAIAIPPRHRGAAATAETPAALLARAEALCLAEAYKSAGEVLERGLAEARATGDRGAESDALAALARTADAAGDTGTADRRRGIEPVAFPVYQCRDCSAIELIPDSVL